MSYVPKEPSPEVQALFDMTDQERTEYQRKEFDKILNSCTSEESRRQLLAIQWKYLNMLDGPNKIVSPVERMNRTGVMMIESLNQLNQVCNDLVEATKEWS